MSDWLDWLEKTGQTNKGPSLADQKRKEAEAAAKRKADAEAAQRKAAQLAAQQAAQRAAAAAAAEKAKKEAAAAAHRAKVKKASDDMMLAAVKTPDKMFKKAQVANIDPNTAGTNIDPATGQLTKPAPQVTTPDKFEASKITPDANSKDLVADELGNLKAVEGSVSDKSKVNAVTMDPAELAALDLEAKTLAESQKVAETDKRKVEDGELVSGSTVDMTKVDEALDFEAAQATASKQATVQGQLDELMADFDDGNTPSWAAGAMRNATSVMAARGLASSSMAGQAIIQATMESALPIAMQDAQTNATFEMQNLSNRQQKAMFAAEQRASFLGMEFTQQFQTRVANAAKISDIANMNFTAEQQVALENAKMAQTVDLANMNAVNAKMMSDAAAMSQLDITNLNNRQQAEVQNAQAFLAMDMANFDRQQQTDMFKSQQVIQSIFTDQAAINASKQFNAASENQTNQFFANMENEVQKFNAGMELQVDQFNAQNALVIAQANAQWRQNTTVANASAQNAANLQHAQAANGMTMGAIEQIWQRERDLMDNSFRQSEGAADRALSIFLQDMQHDFEKGLQSDANKAQKDASKGYIFSKLLGL